MKSLKNFVKSTMPWLVDVRNQMVNRRVASQYKGKGMREVFSQIYYANYWGDKESKSGPGSNLQQTQVVRSTIEEVIRSYKISTMLDIPCGDFNWMKDVNLGAATYVGGDIVKEIVDHNNSHFSDRASKVSFGELNLTSSDLPESELLFCRDCLVHFSYADVRKALINIKRSKSKYFFTTTFPHHNNRDIITGDWRPLNLERPPFNFPEPLAIFNEQCQEENGKYRDKSLALWLVNEIPVL